MKNLYVQFIKITSLAILFVCLSTGAIFAQSNQYLHFDGSDDFVEVPNASSYIAGGDGITMAGWFYCDALEYGKGMTGFRNGGSGDGEMYLIQLNDGSLECRLIVNGNTSEVVGPNFTVIPEVWQHYAWVYTGSQVILYVDGNEVGSAPSNNGTITSTDTPLSIGSLISPFNFYFNGRIDEYSLWSKGLSQGEIQDMMADELSGDEAGLELYYKFNQGVPDEDNTSIDDLISEVGGVSRNGSLTNFDLTGTSSNFGGELDLSFQAISFPAIPNKLTSAEPFDAVASSSADLPVFFFVDSGPATISGNTITLDGTPGEVIIRAVQPGEGIVGPASDVQVSFQVLDPDSFVPVIDARSPYDIADVYDPELVPIQLAAISSIDYPELFSVDKVVFLMNGEQIEAKSWGNNHYTAWWTPPSHSTYTMNIISTNNYGASNLATVNFEVKNSMPDLSVQAAEDVHLYVNDTEETVTATLPCYAGAFDEIRGLFDIGCPVGGCDPWDRVSHIEVKGHNGEWYEIIRYITPYGIACNSEIDLTDFMSLLQGKVDFRFTLVTFENGLLYTLDLDYIGGSPDYPYGLVEKLWNNNYAFGDLSDLQPCETFQHEFHEKAEAATIKLVSTGHGWGDNNTDNAAEFHDVTHHIWVNDASTFSQYNWLICDPNPDGCNDQFGTWEHSRAGWCPGAIAPWFDFDMSSFVSEGSVELNYIFDEDYVDFCHPNNPDCVTGVTCDNCDDGFNPGLIVSSFMISKSTEPIVTDGTVGIHELQNTLAIQVFPNPSQGNINVAYGVLSEEAIIIIRNSIGQEIYRNVVSAGISMDNIMLKDIANGLYFMEVTAGTERGIKPFTIAK